MREQRAKKLGGRLSREIRRKGGVFARTHGNCWQSGWPTYFMFTRETGLRWVQVLGERSQLTWQKCARFRYWSLHGVPIYVVRTYESFDLIMKQAPNWSFEATTTDLEKAEDRFKEMGLPDPDPVNMAEHRLGNKLKGLLVNAGWIFEKTHGNPRQIGWPDYFAFHPEFGYRWVELKTKKGRLRPTQVGRFNQWTRKGVGVWVLNSIDYSPLFQPPNWKNFPRDRWNVKL